MNFRRDHKEQARLEKVLALYAQGLTYKAIGDIMGVSRQRIQQMVRPPIQILDALRKRANNKCERCGIELRIGDGHTHHTSKQLTGRFNDLSKVRYLCRSCHKIEDFELEPEKSFGAIAIRRHRVQAKAGRA